MSYKGIKKNLYCTPMDIRLLNSIFELKPEQVSDGGEVIPQIDDELLENHIADADSFIRGYLAAYYSEDDLIGQTPYYKGPFSVVKNTGLLKLLGVTVASTAITEQWTFTFGAIASGYDTFDVIGTFSGSQGSGNTGAAFTTTNGDLSIAAAAWSYKNTDDSMSPGDKIIICTYVSHPLIRTVSAYLAASSAIDYFYSEAEGSQSNWSKTYYKKAMDILNKLKDPNSGIGLEGNVVTSVDHEAIGYHIDEHGNDVTSYREITNDRLPFRNTKDDSDFNVY